MEIVSERFLTFLSSMETEERDELSALEEEALSEGVPIIRKDTRQFLSVLLAAVKPQRILEVGAGVGFSTLFFLKQLPTVSAIVTIENYPPRIEKARENFAKYDPEGKIRLYEEDAEKVLPTLPEESFDLIFLDAAKGQYLTFFPELLRILERGGVLISDNALQEGDVLESRFAVRRRDRTIHERMREYLRQIMQEKALTTMILPVGDGVAVSVKKTDTIGNNEG